MKTIQKNLNILGLVAGILVILTVVFFHFDFIIFGVSFLVLVILIWLFFHRDCNMVISVLFLSGSIIEMFIFLNYFFGIILFILSFLSYFGHLILVPRKHILI